MNAEKIKLVVFIALALGFLGYSFSLYISPPVPGKKSNPAADHGKQVWQQQNCGACHQVYGLGGYLGPDLTNAYTKRGPAYIRAFVQAGTPAMPSFLLPEKDIDALLEYLREIDASGESDPRTFIIHKNGTIEQ